MSVSPPTDVLDARLRRVEARVSQLEDAVQVYGPPKERPLFTVRPPRFSLSRTQTTLLVYGLFLGGIGLYMTAKLRRGEDPLG